MHEPRTLLLSLVFHLQLSFFTLKTEAVLYRTAPVSQQEPQKLVTMESTLLTTIATYA
jgi:hypothetical protein